jgi:hypothetical protein
MGRIRFWVLSIKGLGYRCSMGHLFGLGRCFAVAFLYIAFVDRCTLR